MCHHQLFNFQDWNPDVHYFRNIQDANYKTVSDKGENIYRAQEALELLFQALFKMSAFR